MAKRSLMLAGGGVKIPFQAGVMQVWMDEAEVEFHHADAVSAACFNLAMWAQGMSGTRIADNWRNTNPLLEVDVDFRDLTRLLYARSLFDLNAFRSKVFPAWGIDVSQIRTLGREATFNVYNFSKHQLLPIEARALTEDYLIAAASLPVWFPPVLIDGDTHIDAVFNLASNLEEAIRRGSDELWVIWTISERGEWFEGFVGNFFGIFEAATVNAYRHILARINRNNTAISSGFQGEFGRAVTVRELKAEVPVHYLLNFSQDRAAEAVNRGVEAARQWCDRQNIPRRQGHVYSAQGSAIVKPALQFEEYFEGEANGAKCLLNLKVVIEDLDAFITMPEHEAALTAELAGDVLGGSHSFTGLLNVLVDDGDPSLKQVKFQVEADGLTLAGVRHLRPELSGKKLEVTIERPDWPTLYFTLQSDVLATLKELASFRVRGGNLRERPAALARFGAFYFGRLWDVYERHLLPSSPF